MSSAVARPTPGIGSLTVKRRRVGEPQQPAPGRRKRREKARCLSARGLERGAILLPLLLLPRGLLASAPQPPAPASTTLRPPLPLTECSRKPPTLRRGKSALERSTMQPAGRQRQERGESAFHSGPKTIGQLVERGWVFFHQTWEVSLQKFHWFQCLGVGWTDALGGDVCMKMLPVLKTQPQSHRLTRRATHSRGPIITTG